MSVDTRRHGDIRPLRRTSENVCWKLDCGRPFRWLPRHGDPWCIAEWIAQKFVRLVAFLPFYIAVVVTLMLYILIFGIPFVDGAR